METNSPPPLPSKGFHGRGRLYIVVGTLVLVVLAGVFSLWYAHRRTVNADPTRKTQDLLAEIGSHPRSIFNPGRPTVYAEDEIVAIGSAAVPALLENLVSPNQHYLARVSAIHALGRIGDTRALPYLERILESKEDGNFRSGAAWSLGQIRNRAAVSVLLTAVKDSDKWVRSAAARALGDIGDPGAAPRLVEALTDTDSEVRKEAAYSLGKIKPLKAIEPLIVALQDHDKDVRYYAARSLGLIQDPRALPSLRAASQDKDNEVRSSVEEAIAQITAGTATQSSKPASSN